MRLTKLEIAERQLGQAIRLFFDGGDDVSIHTLTAAAGDILDDLAKARGVTTFIEEIFGRIVPEDHQQLRQAMRSPQNGFKHADRDADSMVEYDRHMTVLHLYQTCVTHQRLTDVHLPETLVFEVWLHMTYPESLGLESFPHPMANLVDPTDLTLFSEEIDVMRRRWGERIPMERRHDPE